MPDTHQSVAAIDLLFSMACRHVDVAEYPRARAGGRPPLKTSENRPGWGANAQLCGDRFPAVGIGFQNPAPMLLAQNNHMIDTLAPDRSDQPFGKAILPRRGWSNGLVPDAHGTQSARDDSAGDSIPISDHIARSHVPGRRLVDLTCNPLRRRVGCDVYRLAPKLGARKKIGLERIEDELALLPTSFLSGFEADVADLGVLGAESVDLGPLIGRSDEVLVDPKDHTLVRNGLFIAQVKERLLACRAIKAHSVWLLSPTESLAPSR
jgi:hypothetical protein